MSRATPTATTKRRAAPLPADERRTVIIEAVLPLLVEHGLNVTTRQMSVAAGVSEGTIFNVFSDKDELIGAVLEHAIDQQPFERSITAIDPDLPFDQRLVRATELIQQRTVDIWQLVSQFGKPNGGHRPMPTSQALIDLLASRPERLRLRPEEAAATLRSLALAMSHPMLAPVPATPEHIVDVLLNGVGS